MFRKHTTRKTFQNQQAGQGPQFRAGYALPVKLLLPHLPGAPLMFGSVSSINLFISGILEALSTLLRTAFNGSACCVEMNFHCLLGHLLFCQLVQCLSCWELNKSHCGCSWARRINQPAARIRSKAGSGCLDAMTMITRPVSSSHTDLCLTLRARVHGPWYRSLFGGLLAPCNKLQRRCSCARLCHLE